MKMRYALVNGERQEAQKGLIGNCQCCNSPVIAKCGNLRVKHWAHKAKVECDLWWENETEWHRTWKEQFPKECQEIIHYAEDNEKHIADVKTDQGYVIEFQHSYIKPDERKAREDFYKKMVWIVDGSRRSRDKEKFRAVWEQSIQLDGKVQVRELFVYFDECALLRDWSVSSAPVFFDFGEDILYGLKVLDKRAYGFRIGRNELISYLRPAPQMSFEALMRSLDDFLIIKKTFASAQKNLQLPNTYRPLSRSNRRL